MTTSNQNNRAIDLPVDARSASQVLPNRMNAAKVPQAIAIRPNASTLAIPRFNLDQNIRVLATSEPKTGSSCRRGFISFQRQTLNVERPSRL
jgi:hypothetical protein